MQQLGLLHVDARLQSPDRARKQYCSIYYGRTGPRTCTRIRAPHRHVT